MKYTNGKFVSEVRGHLKAVNKDDYISARLILSTAYVYAQYLINTRPLSKTLRDTSIFTEVSCIEMVRVKKHACDIAEFKTCDKIMKSKKVIPDIFTGKMGSLITYVLNIDDSQEYEQIKDPSEFKDSKEREFGHVLKYYYISGGYLYILNSTPERVGMNALFIEEDEAKALSSCDECDECASKLENLFPCPEAFKSTVRDQTVQLLLAGHRQIPEDENPNLDSNIKSATQ